MSTGPSTASAVKHLVFIDPSVDEYQRLVAGVNPDTEVLVLHPSEDGVQQITQALATRQPLDSVHLVAHGRPGSLRLGNVQLSLDNIEAYSSHLQQWRQALSEKASLLIYGCKVAATEQGRAYLRRLSALVGAEIAASEKPTGSAALGGDWQLEVRTGLVEASLAFKPETRAAYASVLADEEADVLLEEDFSNSSGTLPYNGWTSVLLEGEPETDAWRLDNPGDRSFLEDEFEAPFAIYDSDALSNDEQEESVAFVSPFFDASTAEGVFLQYDQYYYGFGGGEYASQIYVETSTNGTDWEIAYSIDEEGFQVNSPIVDLTNELAGETAQIRFRFDGNWSYLWAIDDIEIVDYLEPGVSLPAGLVGVSEDNVPDPLNFQFLLESRPTAPVTLSFDVDEAQLEPIESLTFTPEDWNIPQTSVVEAVDDGIDEGNDQVSNVSITVTSEDSDYDGLTLEDVPVEITENVIPGFTSYRTVEKTFEDLSALAEANPGIASWIDIGDSYDRVTSGGSEGYDIYAIELTNQSNDEDKPTLYVQGAIHAREYTTAELVTRFAEDLVAGYGTDADTTWLLDEFKISIVPIVNPDGRKFAEQGYSWRKNTNPEPNTEGETAPFPTYGVDLNRNFGAQWGEVPGGSSGDPGDATYRGTSAFSEPETQAVRDYVTALFPDQKGPDQFDAVPDDATGIFIDVHSYGNLILYPFGSTTEPAPNKKALETLGRKFGYFTGIDGEAYNVQQAVGLYPTDGTTDDWAYETLGLAGYTYELGTQFFEESDYFEEVIVPEATPSLFYAAKAAYRPYQQPSGPDTVELSADLEQVVAGTTVEITATADDTRYDDGIVDPEVDRDSGPEPTQAIASARYSIDALPWEADELGTLSAADGAFDSSVEGLTGTLDTSDLAPGRYTVFVQSEDANGNYGVASAVFVDVLESPTDAVVTSGSEADETLVGSDGSEVFYARGGADLVAGGFGDDLLFGGAGADVLRGDRNERDPGGTEGGDDTLYGGAGDDRLGGKGGDDELWGEAGDDDLWGDDGDDILRGGLGDDILTGDDFSGGEGSDVFVLAAGEGTDTITDFEVGTDLIGLAGLSFEELSLGTSEGGAAISFGSELLAVLDGVSEALTASDFTPVA